MATVYDEVKFKTYFDVNVCQKAHSVQLYWRKLPTVVLTPFTKRSFPSYLIFIIKIIGKITLSEITYLF